VVANGKVAHDAKAPKEGRSKLRSLADDLEAKLAEGEMYEPMRVSVNEFEISGVLTAVERTTENGEEIIVLRF
jgi:hypothetical protein